MDPAFWNNLPAIIAAVMGGLTAIIAAFNALLTRRIDTKVDRTETKVDTGNRKIDQNTDVTIIGQAEVKKDAATAAKASDVAAKSAERIEEKLNGGPNGLTTFMARVTMLENQFVEFKEDVKEDIAGVKSHCKELVSGQADIAKSLMRLTESLKTIPREDIRGETGGK